MNEFLKPKEFKLEWKFPEKMEFDELLDQIGFGKRDIVVTLKTPIRSGGNGSYNSGKITGFKSGLIGGGWFKYKNGVATSFDSDRIRWIKKPKIQITYNIFDYGGREHSDWVEVDNCLFTISDSK